MYHRRFRPRVRVSVTKTSCGTIAVSLHGSKVIDQGLSDFLNDQDSLLATTAGCQWCSATGSPSNRPRSVHGPSKVPSSGLASYTLLLLLEASLEPDRSGKASRNKAHGRRTRRPGRFFCRGMRIRRAGYGPHRRPAGDKRIGHHPIGSVRRCFTIEKVSPAAETG